MIKIMKKIIITFALVMFLGSGLVANASTTPVTTDSHIKSYGSRPFPKSNMFGMLLN